MPNAVVYLQGSAVFVASEGEGEGVTLTAEEASKPGPIVPELKELAWGAGSFVVFALLMRFVLFKRVKTGMDARYNGIQADHDAADRERSDAKAELSSYEGQVAAIKAEAASRIDAARVTLEGERQAQLADVNARIAQARSESVAQAETVRAEAQQHVHAAVSDVAGRAGELATGRKPSQAVVSRVVDEVMAR